MYPDLFSIGPLTVHTYGLFVAMGVLAALVITIKLGRSVGISAYMVTDMGVIMLISGIAGSRFLYVIINLDYYKHHLLAAFRIWEGGLVFSGGILAVLVAVMWYVKRRGLSLLEVGDLWSPGASLGQAIGRIGCFMAGCCYGKPTDSPLGVVFTSPHSLAPLNIPLHPTQLYHAFSGFVIFLVLWFLHARKKYQGQVFLWLLILHSTARLLIERFRGDNRGLFLGTDMTITQFISLVILLGAVTGVIVLKSRQHRGT